MEPPADADTLLSDRDGFHDAEFEPLLQCPDGLAREEIVSAALADAKRGEACSVTVLETDLNNSVRLNYARTKLEYNKEQMDRLAEDMMIGQSKAYVLWKVANHEGYIALIWKKVEAERAAHAKRGKHGLEFRAKGWKHYFEWCLKKDGIKREKKLGVVNPKSEPLVSMANPNPNKALFELAAETPGERAAAAGDKSSATIRAQLAARELQLERKNRELAAARAEIHRLKAEIERLRHRAVVSDNIEATLDRNAANDDDPAPRSPVSDPHTTPEAFAPDPVAMDPESHKAVASGTVEPLCGSNADEKDSRPPKRGRGRPRVHPVSKKLSAAQRAALEIAETGSTVKWDDDVHAATKRALVETLKFANFDDGGRPALTEAGRAMLDLVRTGDHALPLA